MRPHLRGKVCEVTKRGWDVCVARAREMMQQEAVTTLR